ncbi:MAG: 50S ribosomal protein L1, partial [bacterium]
ITYRVDKFGNIQVIVGKVSFQPEFLVENIKAVTDLIQKIKPSTVKGIYLKNVAISSTMGPGVSIAL